MQGQRSGAMCSLTFSNRLRSLQWEPQNSKDKKKRNLLYISYLQVWTTSEKIWRLDIITHEFWWLYPHGNNGTTDRSISALVRSSPASQPVCSTSPHVNSSSNIFWGAQPKQTNKKKHETQRRVWGSSTSERNQCWEQHAEWCPMNSGSGREFNVGRNSAEPHRDRRRLWNQAAKKGRAKKN